MYKLIGHGRSRAFRVMWALEELGLDYDHLQYKPHSPELASINPTGKIPALIDGEDVVIDSVAIIQYLADKHQRLTHPAGTIARAQQDGLTQLICEEIDGSLWMAARHSFVLPEQHRVDGIKPSLRWEFAKSIERLSSRINESTYLMGDELSVPDIVLGHCLGWAISAKFDPFQSEPIKAYFQRLTSRQAYQAARQKLE